MSKITVFDKEYEVVMSKEVLTHGYLGRYLETEQIIEISPDIPKSKQAEVFFHELTHLILTNVSAEKCTEEDVARVMGVGLYSFFKNNYEYVLQLFNKKESSN